MLYLSVVVYIVNALTVSIWECLHSDFLWEPHMLEKNHVERFFDCHQMVKEQRFPTPTKQEMNTLCCSVKLLN